MGACSRRRRFAVVMAGLVPAINVERLVAIFVRCPKRFGVDTRDKPGHDGGIAAIRF